MGLLDRVRKLKITLHGSLAATGKGHMTPQVHLARFRIQLTTLHIEHEPLVNAQAVMMGFEGSDPETIECVFIFLVSLLHDG